MIRFFTLLAAALFAMLLAGPQLVAATEEARQLYRQARAEAIPLQDALMKLEQERQRHGENPLIMAYSGSLIALQASADWWPFNRQQRVSEGTDLLERATAHLAESHADFFEIMTVSAVTNARIPGFLGRRGYAIRDFQRIQSHRNFATLSRTEQATVFAWLARLLGTGDPAYLSYVNRAVDSDPLVAHRILED